WPRTRARSRPARRAARTASPSTTSCCASKNAWAIARSSPAERPSGNEETGAGAPRRKRLEQGKPVHRLDGRRPLGYRTRGGEGSRPDAEGAGLRVRRGLYFGAEAGDSHAVERS